jgi:hypothetical protein
VATKRPERIKGQTDNGEECGCSRIAGIELLTYCFGKAAKTV